MRRRQFITLLGGAAAATWPLAARAQQPTVPVVGYLSGRSSDSDRPMLSAIRQGLGQMGFAEGRNIAIEQRFADGDYARLTALARELVQRRVALIMIAAVIASNDEALHQLQASQVPIVFVTGGDPVSQGLVTRFDHPGGNVTGVATLIVQVTAKNLGLLRDLVPNATRIAVLGDPNTLSSREAEGNARDAAATLGLQMLPLSAGTDAEIDEAFTALQREAADALLLTVSPFFLTRARQIAALAARQKVPTMYFRREFAEAGGLVSYGYATVESYRQMGLYAGRILKGEKPADLPIVQPTKFELVINLKTAKALGLTVPDTLLALADEVIE
jgi:putative ABC transport system substrate-binding protein